MTGMVPGRPSLLQRRRVAPTTRTWKVSRMGFKQYLIAEVAKGLDETYKVEDWEQYHPGKAYFSLHLNTIEQHERAAATFREYLGRGGMRVLESGCGTGRWMAYFEKLG